MDLDHLFKLVVAARDEAEALNRDGPAYADLLRYLAQEFDPPPQCPDCRRHDRVEPTDPITLTAEQAGQRWWCERCNLVFGRREED